MFLENHQRPRFVHCCLAAGGRGWGECGGVTPPITDDARHRETFGQPM